MRTEDRGGVSIEEAPCLGDSNGGWPELDKPVVLEPARLGTPVGAVHPDIDLMLASDGVDIELEPALAVPPALPPPTPRKARGRAARAAASYTAKGRRAGPNPRGVSDDERSDHQCDHGN